MKISVTCGGCGKSYAVDPANAGRRGRCARCGEEFTVPSAAEPAELTPTFEPEPRAAADPEPEGYALGDLGSFPSAYVPAPGAEDRGPEARTVRPRVRKTKKAKASETFDIPWPKAPRPGQFARFRRPLIGLGVTLAVLVVLALIVPSLATAVGLVLAVAGVILLTVGFLAGAYTAFTEDFVHGFFYLVFFPYAAYYFVSRWEEMRLQLAAIIAGLVLLAVGGKALEYGGSGSPVLDAEPGAEATVEGVAPDDPPPPVKGPRARLPRPAR